MHYRVMFRGEYISASEFGDKQPTLTIGSVRLVKIDQEDGRQRERGVVTFRETERGWVLNRTNSECLAAMFGADTESWIGKRVTLYSTLVKLKGASELGIRIKGSPDISESVTATIKLPRKRPFDMLLEKTAAKDAA